MSEQGQQQQAANRPLGCLVSILTGIVRAILRLLGIGWRGARATVMPPDEQFKEYVDAWVSERIAGWLTQTRAEINTDQAAKVLNGESAHFPEVTRLIRETLVDAKVTFSQRDGKQFLSVEAYMSPRQQNGTSPQVLRWRAEKEIGWADIPNEVRERLIRLREPVTLAYSVPN